LLGLCFGLWLTGVEAGAFLNQALLDEHSKPTIRTERLRSIASTGIRTPRRAAIKLRVVEEYAPTKAADAQRALVPVIPADGPMSSLLRSRFLGDLDDASGI
jgi:hypothetical protein